MNKQLVIAGLTLAAAYILLNKTNFLQGSQVKKDTGAASKETKATVELSLFARANKTPNKEGAKGGMSLASIGWNANPFNRTRSPVNTYAAETAYINPTYMMSKAGYEASK